MNENNGAFYCPVCGQKTASWENDFSAEDAVYLDGGAVVYTGIYIPVVLAFFEDEDAPEPVQPEIPEEPAAE